MDFEARLDVVESEAAVRRLALEYCHGADKRDLARFASVWAPGAVWSPREGVEARGVEAICEIVQVQWRAFSRYVHWTTNHVVDIRGERADGECDVAVAVLLSEDRWYLGGGTYYDRYVRVDGRWLIERRDARGDFDFNAAPRPEEVQVDMRAECAPFLTTVDPVVTDQVTLPPAPGQVLGRWGRQDIRSVAVRRWDHHREPSVHDLDCHPLDVRLRIPDR